MKPTPLTKLPHPPIRLSSVVLLVALLCGLIAPLAAPPVAMAASAVRSFGGGTNFPANDDGSTGPINLGFNINYFGENFSQAYVNNNGNITFGAATSSYTPGGMAASTFKMIAGLWYDVDTRGAGTVTYGTGTVDGRNAFYVTYSGVGYYNSRTDRLNTFQIIVISRADTGSGNFDIEYNYNSITYDPAGAGYSDGAGGTNDFQFAGSLTAGGLTNGNATTGLANYSTNSGVLGRHVLPVRGSTPFVVQLASPADNATNIPPATTLSWQPLAGATAFRVLVANNVGLTSPVVDQGGLGGATTSYAVSGLASSTSYYWAVEATDGSNTTRSNVRRFTTSSNTPPTISGVPSQTVNEATPTGAVGFTVGDAQTPAGSLTLSGSSSNTALVPNGNIVFGGSGANRSVNVTPAPGQYGGATITLTVADGNGGNASTSFHLTVNGVPRVSSPAEGAAVNTLSPTFAGQATVGALVTVLRAGEPFCTATANSSGAWTCSGPVPGEGAHSFTFAAALNGKTTATASRSLLVDVTVPTQPTIVSSPVTSDRTPVLAGTAEPGSAIRVGLDTDGNGSPDVTYATTASAAGAWSVDLGAAAPVSGSLAGGQLADGGYTVRVTSTDTAGNTSPAATQSLRVDASAPAAPVFATRPATNDRTPVLAGTAEANSTVAVGIDTDGDGSSDLLYTVAAGADGSWSVDTGSAPPTSGVLPTGGLAEGAYTLRAAATDAAGNTGATATRSLTVDVTSPAAPAFTSASLTNSASPTFAGTAEPNSAVALAVDLDGDGVADVVYSAAASGAGAWSVDSATATPASGSWPAGGLVSGGYSLSATATDAAGNRGLSSTQGLVVDLAPPAAPVVGTAPDANAATPVLFGTAEPGSTVRVTFDPDLGGPLGEVTFAAVADAAGAWSVDTATATPEQGAFSGLGDGGYALRVTATDPAGNTSPETAFALGIDTVQPEAPSVSSAALTADRTPTFSGVAEPGSTVRVTFDPDLGGPLGEVTFAVVADAAGGWSVDTGADTPESGSWPAEGLTAGAYSVSFTATDESSNLSDTATQTLVVDLTAPIAATVSSPLAGNDPSPAFAGAAEANSTVRVGLDLDGDGAADVVFTTMADGAGRWSIDAGTATPASGSWPAAGLDDGDYAAVVTSTDGAGNETVSPALTLHIDTTPPAAPAFTTPLTSDRTPTFSGTADVGSLVTLALDLDGDGEGDVIYQAVATPAWSFDTASAAPASGSFPAGGLDDGSYALVATAADAYGNLSLAATQQQTIDTTPPAAPTFVSGALTNNHWPVVEGTAEPNSTLTLVIDLPGDPDPVYTLEVGPSGTWRLDPATATPAPADAFPVEGLPDGSYTLSATATDVAGNVGPAGTQTLGLDATPPEAPAITSGARSNDRTPLFAGTADPNSAVSLGLDLNGDNNPDVIYATTTDGAGRWSVETPGSPASGSFPAGGLSDGIYAVRVLVTDQIGNTSPAAVQSFAVDTVAPAQPTIGSAPDSNNTTPTLSGTAEPGSTVLVGLDLEGDGTADVVFTATAAADGSWSVDTGSGGGQPADAFPAEGLGDGSYGVIVTAGDAAGNLSPAAAQTLTVDTAAPAQPTIASPADLADPTPALSGTAEPNSTVRLTIDLPGDADPVYTVTADGAGAWSLDTGAVAPTTGSFMAGGLADGPYTVSLTATDAAGNTSAAVTQEVTIDTVSPAIPMIESAAAVNSPTPVFAGTAEPDASMTLALDLDEDGGPDVVYHLTTGADGRWSLDTATAAPASGSFPAGGLADGTYPVSAFVSDAAGNHSFAASQNLTVDTVAPAGATFGSPASTNDRTPIFFGAAEPESTITIGIDLDGDGAADVAFATRANLAGNWSIDTGTVAPASGRWPDDGLAEGAYALLTTVADLAGNRTTSSRTQRIDLTALTPPAFDGGSNTASRWPALGGSAAAGSLVTVGIDLDGDGRADVTYTTTAGPDGAWSVETATATPEAGAFPAEGLPDGGYQLLLTTTDEAGNLSAAASLALTVDTLAPAAPSLGSSGATTDPTPVLRGTAEPGSLVVVGIDLDGDGTPDVTYTTVATAPAGAWSLDLGAATPVAGALPSGGLPTGGHDVTVLSRDAAGNESAPLVQALVVAVGGPRGLAVTTPPAVDDATPALRGLAEPGSVVTIALDLDGDGAPDVTYTTTANPYGAWSLDLGAQAPTSGTFPQGGLSDGSYGVIISTAGGAGQEQRVEQQLTVDRQAPPAPVIGPPAHSGDRWPAFSGTAEPGSTVTVGVDLDGDGAFDVLYSALAVAPSGSWSVATGSGAPFRGSLPPAGLGSGRYTVGAWATDVAGNSGPLATSQLLIDLAPPTAPRQGSAPQTGDRTPTLFGVAEPGSAVTVALDLDGDGVPDVTYGTTADATGRWSVNTGEATPVQGTFPAVGLNDGTYIVAVTATDAAGNRSATSRQSLVIDGGLPVAPSIASAPQTGDRTPAFSGEAQPGSTVTVALDLDGDGAPDVSFSTAADPDGRWSLDTGADLPQPADAWPAEGLASGSYGVRVTATTPAGVSAAATQTLRVDVTPPAAPLVRLPAGNSSPWPILGGTAEPGSVVEVALDMDGDGTPDVVYTTLADTPGGAWAVDTGKATPTSGAFPAAGLPPGSHGVKVRATDPAGNVGQAFVGTIGLDTRAPGAPTLTAPGARVPFRAFPILAGTAEAGSTVIVAVDMDGDSATTGDIVTYEVVAGPDGRWSVATASAAPIGGSWGGGLVEGATPGVRVVSRDAAGNVSFAAHASPSVDTIAPQRPESRTPHHTSDATPVFSGRAEPGGTVRLVLDLDGDPRTPGEVVFETVADEEGNWSIDTETARPVAGVFPKGGIPMRSAVRGRVTVRDLAGNESVALELLLDVSYRIHLPLVRQLAGS